MAKDVFPGFQEPNSTDTPDEWHLKGWVRETDHRVCFYSRTLECLRHI
jgi:hypothetical protein